MIDDPYETLGLTPDADEAAVRRRYLELVREFPPERAPERFAQVRAAYEAVNDPVARLKALLFAHKNLDSIDRIEADVRARAFDPRQVSLRKVLERAERL